MQPAICYLECTCRGLLRWDHHPFDSTALLRARRTVWWTHWRPIRSIDTEVQQLEDRIRRPCQWRHSTCSTLAQLCVKHNSVSLQFWTLRGFDMIHVNLVRFYDWRGNPNTIKKLDELLDVSRDISLGLKLFQSQKFHTYWARTESEAWKEHR